MSKGDRYPRKEHITQSLQQGPAFVSLRSFFHSFFRPVYSLLSFLDFHFPQISYHFQGKGRTVHLRTKSDIHEQQSASKAFWSAPFSFGNLGETFIALHKVKQSPDMASIGSVSVGIS